MNVQRRFYIFVLIAFVYITTPLVVPTRLNIVTT